jgi:sulfoxide reductase catalytic subunit YedY
MAIVRKRRWELPESAATPEFVFLRRREFVKAIAAGPILAAASGAVAASAAAQRLGDDPSIGRYPFKKNDRYELDRPLTPERDATTYNNFYEFGSHKEIHRAAQALPIRPWALEIAGLVEKPMTVGIDELLDKMPLDERLYRHRCVEAWAMAVPWSGFPLKALVEFCRPLGSVKYVEMTTFMNASVAPGQKQFWYPWPYLEGMTIGEATNELAYMATGVYGKPMVKQMGAPLRLVLPWKYGFKSIKSVVKISFTEKRPVSFWERLQPSEYGFWANVNPQMPHPRWSQTTERMLGSGDRRPTLMFNGYGEQVAHMYSSMKDEKLFM